MGWLGCGAWLGMQAVHSNWRHPCCSTHPEMDGSLLPGLNRTWYPGLAGHYAKIVATLGLNELTCTPAVFWGAIDGQWDGFHEHPGQVRWQLVVWQHSKHANDMASIGVLTS